MSCAFCSGVALSQLRPTALAVMVWKLKCGSTLASMSATTFLRSPFWISLSFWTISTTSSVTVFTSASGGVSSTWAAAWGAASNAAPAIAAAVANRTNLGSILASGGCFEHVHRRLDRLGRCVLRRGLRRGLRSGLRLRLHRLAFGARDFARRARRITVVDLAAAALQEGVALEHVLVERGLLEDAAGVEQVRALADATRDHHRIAHANGPVVRNRIDVYVEHQAGRVARRSEEH